MTDLHQVLENHSKPLVVPDMKDVKVRPPTIDFVRDSIVKGHKLEDPGLELTRGAGANGLGYGSFRGGYGGQWGGMGGPWGGYGGYGGYGGGYGMGG